MPPRNGKRLLKSRALIVLLASPFFLGAAHCKPKPPGGDTPPPMPVCIGDGLGGADCVASDGKSFYCDSKCLKSWWMTDSDSMAAFTAWCYGAPVDKVKVELQVIEKMTKGEENGGEEKSPASQ